MPPTAAWECRSVDHRSIEFYEETNAHNWCTSIKTSCVKFNHRDDVLWETRWDFEHQVIIRETVEPRRPAALWGPAWKHMLMIAELLDMRGQQEG